MANHGRAPLVLALVVSIAPSCFATEAVMVHTSPGDTTYYVDRERGDDAHAGLTPEQPWRSLERVNQTRFAPGDRILFRAGTRHTGHLEPKGSGALVDGVPRPIVIDRYGEGPRPRLDGEGETLQALYLHNVEYWEVRNLEITNTGESRQAARKGVFVHVEDFGTAHHIHLKNLYVHDVNGSNVKGEGGGSGIQWRNEGERVRSRFDGLVIEDCHLVRTDRDGIKGSSTYWSRDRWYPSLNVVIRGNRLEDIGGDGIVPIGCDGALVESNVLRGGGQRFPEGDAAAGIWPWSCDNTTVQLNEVSGFRGSWDAQGFDSDWNCRNTLIQYNYSHDNEGGFILICNKGTDTGEAQSEWNIGNTGTIVRYNVSVNDGFRLEGARGAGFSPAFHIAGPTRDTLIHNNVIYVGRKADLAMDTDLIALTSWDGWPTDTRFYNNIFFMEGEATYSWGESTGNVFENNVFFGTHHDPPDDPHAVTADPRLVDPGRAEDGRDSLAGYQLESGSPCAGAGRIVEDAGGRDFWGHPLPTGRAPSVGAFEPPSLSAEE